MAHVAVSAVGKDRPGIVAAVTGVLVDAGCNLEDTSMTILRGHFAMMLVVSTPPELSAAALEEQLAPVGRDLELVLSVREIAADAPAVPVGHSYVVSVYGGDKPGIVHRITSLLADLDVNVVDLDTRVIGDPDHPVYAMILDVALPETLDVTVVEKALDEAATDLGVECSIHADDPDIL